MDKILRTNENDGMVVVTADAFAGSGGKGALNAYIADKQFFHLATNNYATNAGHMIERDDGVRILNQHLCSAFISKNTEIYINAGASIDIKTLFKEIDTIEALGYSIKDRLTIHPCTNVIIQDDIDEEKRVIKSGSTFKGCGAALARKTLRVPGQKLAKDYEILHPYIKDRTMELNEGVARGMKILVEGSQGIDLDINHSQFPHCTSRQTHPTQLVADAGLPGQAITNVIVNLRTQPIRINNQSAANDNEQCYSGDYWGAKEISWDDVAQQAGHDPEEFKKNYGYALFTTVTKKLRRVFEFPTERMKFLHAMVGGLLPNSNVLYSLNFINFVDKNTEGVTSQREVFTPKVELWLNKYLWPAIGYHGQNTLKFIRTGPRHSQMVEV